MKESLDIGAVAIFGGVLFLVAEAEDQPDHADARKRSGRYNFIHVTVKVKKVKKAVLNRKAAKGLIRKDQKQRKEVYERKEK